MAQMDIQEPKSLCEEDEDKSIEIKKYCTDCKTTKTPLWRGGPAGPKSLCNACGIRFRKKRKVSEKPNSGKKKKNLLPISSANGGSSSSTTTTTTTTTTDSDDLKEALKMRLIVVGGNMMFQRSSSIIKKQRCQRRRKLGEVEQAAFCLLALKCGSVLA